MKATKQKKLLVTGILFALTSFTEKIITMDTISLKNEIQNQENFLIQRTLRNAALALGRVHTPQDRTVIFNGLSRILEKQKVTINENMCDFLMKVIQAPNNNQYPDLKNAKDRLLSALLLQCLYTPELDDKNTDTQISLFD